MKRLLTVVCLLLWALILPAFAQDDALILTRGQAVTNTLGADSLARVYFFVAVSDERISLTADGEGDLNVGLVLTEPDGTILAQAGPDTANVTQISAVTLPTTANFYVTIFPVGAQTSGTFTLTLREAVSELTPEATASPEATVVVETTVSPEATLEPTQGFGVAPTPQGQVATSEFVASRQVLIPNGINVTLSWAANVDLNLEVRDPVGNTLYFDSRTSPVGGAFGFDANGFCQIISPNPTETATWSPGFLPTGNYEVLVFYRQACENPDPVDFAITVTVNGIASTPVQGNLTAPLANQNSTYLYSFRVNEDTTAISNAGGVYPDSSLNIAAAALTDLVAAAVPATRDVALTDAITQEAYYRVYRYEAADNELVSASATAISGSLDTLLQITDATGNLVGVNDDSNGTRNSEVANLRLPLAGTYYFIVSRYGKEFGGSEGEYSFTLTGGLAQLPPEVLTLNLLPGEIQVVLTWATGADVQLLVRDPAGESVFDDQPTVASGGTLALQGNLNCTRAAGNPASYIYWPQGFLRAGNYEVDVWFQNQCGDAAVVDATLSIIVRGQIVTVETIRPTLDQHYVVGFTVGTNGTAAAQLGGYQTTDAATIPWQEETPVPVSANLPVSGQISDTNVYDTYTFEGTTGQRVIISDTATSPTLDTKLFLMGPSGLQVAENDDSGVTSPTVRRSDALIANFVLPESGTYTIIATRYATVFGGTVGGYTLTLTIN